jgi:hypothetical protein
MDNTTRSNPEHHAASAAPAASFEEVKRRQRATWASGDFGIIGTALQIVGESPCETIDLRAGSSVLDVAAQELRIPLQRGCHAPVDSYEADRPRAMETLPPFHAQARPVTHY